MRKEPIVFAVALAFVGWQARGFLSEAGGMRRSRGGNERSLELGALPDVGAALPLAGRGATFGRNLFEPPSPTTPLPPLDIERPRIDRLPALAPPTGFGPSPRYFGELLRRPERPANAEDLPGLFANIDADGDADLAFDEPESADVEIVEGEDRLPDDPEERAARVLGFKRQYDWIYRASNMFGRILNEDRYELALTGELPEGVSLRFVQVDPFTGRPLYGDNVLEYAAEDIRDWGLRDTVVTRIEVGFASFPDTLPPTRFAEAISFANQCLDWRNETPRALEVAEELFQRAQAINTQDSIEPRLGLARCYELGFRLDDAFRVYRELIDGNFGQNGLVHARLGALQSKLRLDADAEASFERAVQRDGGAWEIRWRYGRFLAERDRWAEAEAQFAAAVQREPRGQDLRRRRVELRLDHARALMQLGRVDQAFAAFQRSLNADPTGDEGLADVCRAGLISAARFVDSPAAAEVLAGAGDPEFASGGFDLKLALGLLALDQGRYADAAALLSEARGLDPLRAHEASRALSRLAEVTGNVEQAESFLEAALAGDPRDAWSLYQAGRLAQQAGDGGRAQAAFEAALRVELDFAPALARLAGHLEEIGERDAAERYYERVTGLEPDNAGLWARRGWNALSTGDLALAERALQTARSQDLSLASARAGLAWWRYATGDAGEAQIQFAEIVDDARSDGAEGPWSAFAETQGARILDHESKEVFRDRFDRADGRIANGWVEDKGVGPASDLLKGAVQIRGAHDASGRTRIFRELPPDRYLAFSAVLTVGEDARGTRSGLFVANERTDRVGNSETRAELAVCRNRDGQIELRIQRKSTDGDAAFVETPGPAWPLETPIRVTIERTGVDLASRFTVYVDGEPIAEDVQIDAMLSSRQNLRFGVFVEGDPGRVADLVVDDVRVVRRK